MDGNDGSGAAVPARRASAVAIGNFDGVHLGHRMLVARAVAAAAAGGLRSVVLTFDRHPATVVRPASAPLLLTSVERKLELLRETGVDEVVVLRFDEARAAEPAEHFVETVLVGELAALVVVVGASFRFGHEQRGDVGLLEQMGARLGFAVDCLDLVDAEAGDGRKPVSSSRIRTLLAAGEVGEAARLLGRPHELELAAASSGGAAPSPGDVLAVLPGLLVPPPGRYRVGLAEPGASGGPHARRLVVQVSEQEPARVVVESVEAAGDGPAPPRGGREALGFLEALGGGLGRRGAGPFAGER